MEKDALRAIELIANMATNTNDKENRTIVQ